MVKCLIESHRYGDNNKVLEHQQNMIVYYTGLLNSRNRKKRDLLEWLRLNEVEL